MTAPTGVRHRPQLRWWREVLIALGLYLAYSLVRNLFGSGGTGDLTIAFRHARSVIRAEEAIGLYFEPDLQEWYLGLPGNGLIRWWNVYYGTAHFVVTIGVLVFAYRRLSDRYQFIRNAIAATTVLALIGFSTFALMPPRLLDDTSRFGACSGRQPNCHGYGYVDTIDRYGGLWKLGEGAVSNVSNQYAAMPSMHFGWSSWCALTLAAGLRRRRWKVAAFLYPLTTLFCIIVTGNHFWLDAIGGALALAGGYLVAAGIERARSRFRSRSATRSPDHEAGVDGLGAAPEAGGPEVPVVHRGR